MNSRCNIAPLGYIWYISICDKTQLQLIEPLQDGEKEIHLFFFLWLMYARSPPSLSDLFFNFYFVLQSCTLLPNNSL